MSSKCRCKQESRQMTSNIGKTRKIALIGSTTSGSDDLRRQRACGYGFANIWVFPCDNPRSPSRRDQGGRGGSEVWNWLRGLSARLRSLTPSQRTTLSSPDHRCEKTGSCQGIVSQPGASETEATRLGGGKGNNPAREPDRGSGGGRGGAGIAVGRAGIGIGAHIADDPSSLGAKG
jgi:hypothetical protein